MDGEEVIMDREEVIMDREEGIMDREEVIMDREEVIMDGEEVIMDREEVIMDREEVIMDGKEVIMEISKRDLISSTGMYKRCSRTLTMLKITITIAPAFNIKISHQILITPGETPYRWITLTTTTQLY